MVHLGCRVAELSKFVFLRRWQNGHAAQVCHDRRKEVVITKCFHLFCRPCIAKNLEIRHRKCPGCGVAFGQADVHSVFL